MKPVFSFIQFSGIRTICADCNRLDYIRSSLKDINRLIFNMNPARRITTNNCVDIHLTRSVCKAANEKEVFKYHHHQCTHLLVVYSIRFLFYFLIFLFCCAHAAASTSIQLAIADTTAETQSERKRLTYAMRMVISSLCACI